MYHSPTLSKTTQQQVNRTKKMLGYHNRAAAAKATALQRPLTRKEYAKFKKTSLSSIPIKTLRLKRSKLILTNP